MTEEHNRLFYGDNLEIMREHIKDESVDLCYIDPPFNSKRNYNQIYNNIGKEDVAQTLAFIDTWEWDKAAISATDEIQANAQGLYPMQLMNLLAGLYKVLGASALLAYLVSMTLRIVEIHRVLKATGSLFLHCDPTASHYLKLILDAAFCSQQGEFINEITWCYSNSGRSKNRFAKKHDIIFWYAKTKNYQFFPEQVSIPYTKSYLASHFRNKDANGKQCYRKRFDAGKWYVYYPDTGMIPNDWWADIPSLNSMAKERLGYPTQKPVALLERIIKATTTKDNIVLDCYCGCGTTIDAAQKLDRKWIGIDITYNSIMLIEERLKNTYNATAKYDLFGVPFDIESARALATRADKTRKEFEKWAILRFTNNKAMINEKKGADSGIDGRARTLDEKGYRDVLFSVKSGAYNIDNVRAFAKIIADNNAAVGFFIVMQKPSDAMKQIAAEMGNYRGMMVNPLARMQFVMVEDMLTNKVSYPLPMMTSEVIKKAQTAINTQQQTLL